MYTRRFLTQVAIAVVLSVGLQVSAGAAETWTFTPSEDKFGPDCLLDLRGLNEKTAGESGWMLARDGKLYIPGHEEAFRGWSAGVSNAVSYVRDLPDDPLQTSARAFAKAGINQIRLQFEGASATLPLLTPGADFTQVNPVHLDRLFRVVGAMKKQGIYVAYCPYWFTSDFRRVFKDNPHFKGFIENGKPFFWCKDLQDVAKGWYRTVLTTKNPATGLTLAEDPTLNILELQNEENLFFGDLYPGCCDPDRWKELCDQFRDWVCAKYGSMGKALAYWQLTPQESARFIEGDGDSATITRPLHPQWLSYNWSNPKATQPTPSMQRFTADNLGFLIYLERKYNEEMARYIKQDLGYKGLILGGNWQSHDDILLSDAVRYATIPPACDCIAYHRYFAPPTGQFNAKTQTWGRGSGFAAAPGEYYRDVSMLANPIRIPTNYRRMRNTPMIMTEVGVPGPNLYDLEGILTVAAYGSMADFDQLDWEEVYLGSYGAGLPFKDRKPESYNIFHYTWPHLFGQFPAASLIYRRGYVKEAPVVVYERRSLDDLCARKLPLVGCAPNSDPAYAGANQLYRPVGKPPVLPDPAGQPLPGGVERLALQVGNVEYEVTTDKPSESKVDAAALARCIDRAKTTVRSVTDELVLNWGDELLTIDAPCAQGVVGLTGKAGKVILRDVEIESQNPLSSVMVVSLDGKPLAESGKVLIEAVTPSRLGGSQVETLAQPLPVDIKDENGKMQKMEVPAGTKHIVALGNGTGFEIDSIKATVTFRKRAISKATPLDLYGYALPTARAQLNSQGGATRVELPAETYFTIVE